MCNEKKSCINLNKHNQLVKINANVTPNAEWSHHIGFNNHVSSVLLMNIHLLTLAIMTSPTMYNKIPQK